MSDVTSWLQYMNVVHVAYSGILELICYWKIHLLLLFVATMRLVAPPYSLLCARPWPVVLSLLVFQCRPLAGWEGLRFVLYVLWSAQSLPAALREEERRGEEGGRDRQRMEECKRGLHSTQQPTLPPAWLEASSYQMPDVTLDISMLL